MKTSLQTTQNQVDVSNNKNYKISLCLICTNNLLQLQETFVTNFLESESYIDFEFVFLLHNSTDGTEDWIRENFYDDIANARVVYYKTHESVHFNISHLKNIIFKLAQGEIVCIIPPQIELGPKFANLVNNDFKNNSNTFIIQARGKEYPSSANEIICVRKADFMNIKGFDENMKFHGWEDVDFITRLQHSGKRVRFVQNPAFFKEVLQLEKYDKSIWNSRIDSIYLTQLQQTETLHMPALILFKDYVYKSGVIIHQNISSVDFDERMEFSEFELQDKNWYEGTWQRNRNAITLTPQKATESTFSVQFKNNHAHVLLSDGCRVELKKVTNQDLFGFVANFEIDHYNKNIMTENAGKFNLDVNKGFYGQAIVFKNFNYDTPIMTF